MSFNEVFKGYCMNAEGRYGDPAMIHNREEFSQFILTNVEKHHELRVTDSGDMLVFHVVEQTLLHPIPEGGSIKNKWNSVDKKFNEI